MKTNTVLYYPIHTLAIYASSCLRTGVKIIMLQYYLLTVMNAVYVLCNEKCPTMMLNYWQVLW